VSLADKFVGIGEGKPVGTARQLFVTVAEGAVLFTVASWAFDLVIALVAPRAFEHASSSYVQIVVMLMAVLVPDGLAAWWIFRRVRTDRSRNDGRRAATAFAVSAPVVLGVGYLLGELVGGYAEVILGRYFVLPAAAVAVIVPMTFIPSGVVIWALHPSGGVSAIPESDQNEHC
jgi:hypothetical protein